MINTNKILNPQLGFLGSSQPSGTVKLVLLGRHYLFLSYANNQTLSVEYLRRNRITEKFNTAYTYILHRDIDISYAWLLKLESTKQSICLSDLSHNLWYSVVTF